MGVMGSKALKDLVQSLRDEKVKNILGFENNYGSKRLVLRGTTQNTKKRLIFHTFRYFYEFIVVATGNVAFHPSFVSIPKLFFSNFLSPFMQTLKSLKN